MGHLSIGHTRQEQIALQPLLKCKSPVGKTKARGKNRGRAFICLNKSTSLTFFIYSQQHSSHATNTDAPSPVDHIKYKGVVHDFKHALREDRISLAPSQGSSSSTGGLCSFLLLLFFLSSSSWTTPAAAMQNSRDSADKIPYLLWALSHA